LGGELGAADQAVAVEADIEVAEDVSRLQAARPVFQRVEMTRRIGAADHRADRGADHDVGHDAARHQRLDDADMGKAARGAAAERQPDHRPPDAAKPDLVGSVLAAPEQILQHLLSPSRSTNARRIAGYLSTWYGYRGAYRPSLVAPSRAGHNLARVWFEAWFMPRFPMGYAAIVMGSRPRMTGARAGSVVLSGHWAGPAGLNLPRFK